MERYMSDDFINRPLTIRDIANLAGVSPATVSNVMNGTGRVSKHTAERVSSIIRETSFNVNASARTLRQKSSRIIGVLVPLDAQATFAFNPYYWHFVDGVMQVAEHNGYDVILKAVQRDSSMSVVQERDLDGIIVVGAFEHLPFTERVVSSEIPSVFVDSYLSDQSINLVNLDDRFGAYLATRHLLGLGHRKLLFVSGPLVQNGVDHERFLGYQKALDEANCVESAPVLETTISLDNAKTLAQQLAYQMPDVTGIVTSADALAMGMIRGYKECGIAVPQQVSIVGYDDIPESGFMIPALTTIHQDVHEKGRRAGQRLIELMNGSKGKAQHVQLVPRLVVRESTAPPLSAE